jgi:hypothetical protein
VAQATTERLPVIDTAPNGLAASVRAVLLTRHACRAVRLAQRAQRAGNYIRARRLAAAARNWAGLAPLEA